MSARLVWVRSASSLQPRLGRIAGAAVRMTVGRDMPRRHLSTALGASLAAPHPLLPTLGGRRAAAVWGRRGMSLSAEELNKQMDEINSQFAEARLLIEDALDSNGTTYFEEDLDDAQVAVRETLELYKKTLDSLDDKRKGEMTRSMGMKMEQLKGELAQIMDSLTHDEDLPPAKGDA
eukprot:CAMPEP_0173435948 /NCGR_PEP_ID=MMETSP1357-20121228/15679_1 /TAXON_ID=77926 /ORGANISM="Hemiselmis rufescens, Strain PCC563" /LENGTH=176 /DNA_ID=CAMNT_0014400989 /DNA_START=32 /DNA_END=562 /DNA_ORIENTATION=+